MRKITLTILLTIGLSHIFAQTNDRIDIPLHTYVTMLKPMDGPTGSTPDPTDPNQFRASLTGNTLTIYTQSESVSYVAIESDFSEKAGEDYFFSLSTDSVTCTINRPGTYTINIGHWNVDFVGHLQVKSVNWYDFNGKCYGQNKPAFIPGMYYILNIQTDKGNSTSKYLLSK
ncbi:MAG: hypothetical protein K6A36_05855 [Paludibacteraceae bacterium]|nr:hypothetical protein [Paludibacteraceae bacterium]